MKIRIFLLAMTLLLAAWPAQAEETDYLALMAQKSEIKAIAKVSKVQRMSPNADGTIKSVTFKKIYEVTPYTPMAFTGSCKTLESSWQKKAAGMVYFNPKPGQLVFVTITTNEGAITSFTPITPELEHVIRTEPHRLTYSHGKAKITPKDW
ncbi:MULTISPECIES: hypothetical protein [unclassified Pseudodesulfovibrio]|uniref:hypothetical protein n=1 Tax=unclassified Pseudodesulfovibrio TaxID=2661612 RepID=UPI000FEBFFBD|nr:MULTISPECIES: hypothetical protein [unclassified Pseudodesulfovibrio]MCJ2165100.1 hypothetical protein [Pseudodesulfovibrio sp. S3-i]RWU03435.1 hypothetical protein DWB63_11535 [Pseudodesulfovibrio sp. S3]